VLVRFGPAEVHADDFRHFLLSFVFLQVETGGSIVQAGLAPQHFADLMRRFTNARVFPTSGRDGFLTRPYRRHIDDQDLGNDAFSIRKLFSSDTKGAV
jgi:hypothetical protein